MLDLATVTADIARWIETFVEVPHPALGGWAPCPYARQARLNQEYAVLGTQHTLRLDWPIAHRPGHKKGHSAGISS